MIRMKQLLIELNNKQAKQPKQKMSKRPKQTFLQRRQTDGYWAHEKMLSVTYY